MPIILPPGLPAAAILRSEGYMVAESGGGASRLRIGLLNLMPDKIRTEIQFARLLSDTSVSVELLPIRLDSYRPKSVAPEHLDCFYTRASDVIRTRLDGLIVTGAPVEHLPFEEVDYWRELVTLMEWARDSSGTTLYVCWSAQAALHHFRQVPKRGLERKAFGVFRQQAIAPTSELMRGLREGFSAPVSRHTEVVAEDVMAEAELEILASSPDSGLCLIDDAVSRAVYMFDHLEYDADTLRSEYLRDSAAGKAIAIPQNYFPANDPAAEPRNTWYPFAALFFRNWLERAAARAGVESAAYSMDRLLAPTELSSANLSLFARMRPDLLTDVVRRLDAIGAVPDSLRIVRRLGDIAVVEIGTRTAHEPNAERIAQGLLKIAGARTAVYRRPDGSGGLFRPGDISRLAVPPASCRKAQAGTPA
jgi:homoserine O-succinyltransferase/O-acetyltransferase